MLELYCLMCSHVWFYKSTSCPNCGCGDVLVNNERTLVEPDDGHYEGDFNGGPYSSNDYGD